MLCTCSPHTLVSSQEDLAAEAVKPLKPRVLPGSLTVSTTTTLLLLYSNGEMAHQRIHDDDDGDDEGTPDVVYLWFSGISIVSPRSRRG